MIALLAACSDRPPDERPTEAPWLVEVGSLGQEEVHTVFPLPDGDVLVAGNHAGNEWIGTGPDDRFLGAHGAWDGFVARLSPQGRTRWARTIGGRLEDKIYTASLAPDGSGVWVAGYLDWEALYVDDQVVTGVVADPDPGTYRPFGVKLDLDGNVVRSVQPEGREFRTASAVAEDTDGNVYLAGETRGPVAFPGGEPLPYQVSDHYLMSWDRSGSPRWLSVLSAESDGVVEGLVATESSVLVGYRTQSLDGVVTFAGSGQTPDTVYIGSYCTVLRADLATGALSRTAFQTRRADLRRLEAGPDGPEASGEVQDWWRDADGHQHDYEGGFTAVLDDDGGILQFREVLALAYGGHGTSAIGSMLPPQGWEFETTRGTVRVGSESGTGWASPGGPRDGIAGILDGDGRYERLWSFTSGGEEDPLDVAVDTLGGIVVVGSFTRPNTEIRDIEGTVLFTTVTPDWGPSGFIVRFPPCSDSDCE